MDRCDECPFVYDELPVADIAGRLRALGPDYRGLLTNRPPGDLRRRSEPGVWTPLEYACHVRDVMVAQRERLALALAEDCPTVTPMGGVGREQLVVDRRYNEQDPAVVADEIAAALAAAADAFAALDEAGWSRACIYQWPQRAQRDMRWLGRHTVHEGVHHRRDADHLLARVT